MFIKLLLIAAVASAELTNWESHGEAMADLHLPVVDQKMIDEVNRGSSNWVAGVNERFVGASLADAKVLMGTLQDTDPANRLPYQPVANVRDLPSDFDWRTDSRASSCPSVKEVRDQANCGSCWAFGSVEAMTDRVCIESNGTTQHHLSAQDVTSCCGLMEGDQGCSGGVPNTVYNYYALNGIVTGGQYGDKTGCYAYELPPCAHHVNGTKFPPCPAEVKTPKCAKACDAGSSKTWASDKVRGKAGYSVCQQGSGTKCADQMAQEIFQNGPITAMFFVHQSFTSYKSGVYSKKLMNDPMLGGHAIKIMGFGVENGEDYWLVANSWNAAWGDAGFFKIKRGTNECQIEDAVLNGGPVAGHSK